MPGTQDSIIADVRRPKGTGGVTKRKDGRWQATCTYRDENDRKKVKTLTGQSKTEALNKIRDWKAGGGERAKGGKTVAQLLDHVLDVVLTAQGLDPQTISDYRGFAKNHIVPRIGSVKLDRLTVRHLDSVALEMMEGGRSRKTAKNCHIFLGACVKQGKRLGWIGRDLASDMMPIGYKAPTVEIYSLAEVLALIEAAADSRVQPAIVLSGLCGLREAECAGIMWSDLDLTAGTLKIERQHKGKGRIKNRTKGGTGQRVIPLPVFVQDYFRRLPKLSPFLMTSVDGKKPIHPSVIYHEVMHIIEAAKMKKIRFHDLRHSANNVLKQLGIPAETRRDILGHSDTSVTENVYTQTVDWEMKEAMEKLEIALRLKIG